MNVIICVDRSPYTEKVLQASRLLLPTRIPKPAIRVVHVIDQFLLASAQGNELRSVEETFRKDSIAVYNMAKDYLGEGFHYIEVTGSPQSKITEITNDSEYDLLIIGTRGKTILSNIFLGSVAEHLLHHTKKPLMIVH